MKTYRIGKLVGKPFAAALAACVISSLGLASNTRADVLLDFDVNTDYTDNFVQMRNTGGVMSWSSANGPDGVPGVISGTHSSTVSQFRYDINQTPGRDTLLTETVAADLRYNTLSGNTNHGIFLRVQDNNLGVLGLVSYLTQTSIRIRLGYGAEMTTGGSGIGTQFWDATFNLSDGSIANAIGSGGVGSTATISSSLQWFHFEFAQTDDDVFNLSVFKGDNLLVSTGDVALVPVGAHTETNIAAYRNAGSVGFRINNGGGSVNSAIDNFTIVPEPASLVLMGLGSLLMVARRRWA